VIEADSLSATVDAVNSAFFDGRTLSTRERLRVARWIAGRQGLPGAYADTFAGFPSERQKGITVFTGERVGSASARHILGEEACRALRLLDVREPSVGDALARATVGLMSCLDRAARDPRNTNPGLYCCGKCSVGVWRHLVAGGLDRHEERLRRGVRHLRSVRDGQCEWRRFPFWYTVLALTDIDVPEARQELKYAAAHLERAATRPAGPTRTAIRRQALARRALKEIS
jgi:hypothetical protein